MRKYYIQQLTLSSSRQLILVLVVSSSSSFCRPCPRRRRRPCPLCPGVVSVVATMRWSHGWIKWRTSISAYSLFNLSYINIQIWKLGFVFSFDGASTSFDLIPRHRDDHTTVVVVVHRLFSYLRPYHHRLSTVHIVIGE